MYIRSDESDRMFSENQVQSFRIHLKSPLMLNQLWKVALVECSANCGKAKLKKHQQDLFIYSDICTGSIVEGEDKPLLRRLVKNTKIGWEYIIDKPFYVPLRKHNISEIRIYIKDAQGNDVTFLEQPLLLTLVFAQI